MGVYATETKKKKFAEQREITTIKQNLIKCHIADKPLQKAQYFRPHKVYVNIAVISQEIGKSCVPTFSFLARNQEHYSMVVPAGTFHFIDFKLAVFGNRAHSEAATSASWLALLLVFSTPNSPRTCSTVVLEALPDIADLIC